MILGAACPKDKETSLTMHIISQVIESIARETVPCCCKNFMGTALVLSCKLANEHLEINLPYDLNINCEDSHHHPYGCRKTKFSYYGNA
ncbi:hypothetical protein CCE28_15200 [Anaeromicrobium sediminis]|uniref:DUF5714 domain-containing protein n=1 Tax=Anaeromicrobium sediminis TaxID=1478221 RepID=A0A267MI30_9FIRM|nr:hypothetical protein CCE28_15200 [Anaeromicrobium sediminis]